MNVQRAPQIKPRLESICSSAGQEEMLGDTSKAAEALERAKGALSESFQKLFKASEDSVSAMVLNVLSNPTLGCPHDDVLEPFRLLISQFAEAWPQVSSGFPLPSCMSQEGIESFLRLLLPIID